MKITKKEMFMFWIGVLIALSGGILGNLLVGTALDIANNGYNCFNTGIFIVCFFIFIGLILFIIKQLEKLK